MKGMKGDPGEIGRTVGLRHVCMKNGSYTQV